jgi:hypothetical protein
MWDLEGGLRLVRAIQPITRRFGYHVALGGGVLNTGESNKDLDLYFLPMGGFDVEQDKPQPDNMREYLSRLWGVGEDIGKDYGNMLYKHAVKFFLASNKKRIDVFIF